MKAGATIRSYFNLPVNQAVGARRPGLTVCTALVLGLASGIVSGAAWAQVFVGDEGLPSVEVNLGVLDVLPNRGLQQQLPGTGPLLLGPLQAPAPAAPFTPAPQLPPLPASPAELEPLPAPQLPPLPAPPAEPAPAPARAPTLQGVAGAPDPQVPEAPQARGGEVANLVPTPGLAADGLAPEGGLLSRIEFLGANTMLPTEAELALTKIAALVGNSDRRVQLNAYAGGTPETVGAARRLSLSRALTVRAFLIEAGVRSTRIDVRALGLASDDAPLERVDIMLLSL